MTEQHSKRRGLCQGNQGQTSVTVTKVYPIPNIEACVEKVSHAKFISATDLVGAYWQVPLTENASNFAAFVIRCF